MEDITNIITNNTGPIKRMDRPARHSPARTNTPSTTSSPAQSLRGDPCARGVPDSPSKSLFTISSNRTHIPTPTKRRYHELRVKQSKLDMLDSQFTSFPLAPPPESEKVTETLKSPEINAQEAASRPQSGLFEGDPIVLVEDYIQQKHTPRKKLSVSDLKASLANFHFVDDSNGEENYLTRTKSVLSSASHPIRKTRSQQLQRQQFHLQRSPLRLNSLLLINAHIEETEERDDKSTSTLSHGCNTAKSSQSSSSSSSSYRSFHAPTIKAPSIASFGSGFNSVPTLKLSDTEQPSGMFSLNNPKSSLKYCIICETPLYDLSSLLTSDTNYNEFVCSNCTEKYETLSKLVENFDEAVSELNPIPEDIEDIEEALNQPGNKKLKVSSDFSVTLINKLQVQLGTKSPAKAAIDSVSVQWLLSAKKKLRWRWRISGLLPRFLDKKSHYNA